MRLTSQVQNAILLLKALDNNEPRKLADIAEKYSLSLNFLEQIARKLRIAKLVKSQRGPGGGYLLIEGNAINLLDVVNALDNVDVKAVTTDQHGLEILRVYQGAVQSQLFNIKVV